MGLSDLFRQKKKSVNDLATIIISKCLRNLLEKNKVELATEVAEAPLMSTNSKLHPYVHRIRHILWGWRSRFHRQEAPPISTSASTPDGNTLQLAVGRSSQSEQQVLSDTLCITGVNMHNAAGFPAKLDAKAKPSPTISIMMVMRNKFFTFYNVTDISRSLSRQIHPRVISMKCRRLKHDLLLTMHKLNRSSGGIL